MRVPMRGTGAERPVVAVKSGKPDGAKGSRHSACSVRQPQKREERSGQAKPFCISKWVVLDAYKRVRAKRGAAGVDSESIEVFERDLKNNLYRIWNRMSSGTYFPPPVKTVEIPKKDGGVRSLGIPTVSDRVAQTVVKLYLEPVVEPSFHPDSYGYRPKKSALDALELPGSDAGSTTGSLTWTSGASLTTSTTCWSCARLRSTRGAGGSFSTSSGGWKRLRSKRMGPWCRARRGRRKAESSAPCWPTSSYISASTIGCVQRTRKYRSSVMQMMLWRIAKRKSKRSESWTASGSASNVVISNSIL